MNAHSLQAQFGEHYDGPVYLDGHVLHPDRSQAVWNHSPDGFAWGYGGSGPAQLALAVLLELSKTEKPGLNSTEVREWAVHHHQSFKRRIIAPLPQGDFSIRFTVEGDTFAVVDEAANA